MGWRRNFHMKKTAKKAAKKGGKKKK